MRLMSTRTTNLSQTSGHACLSPSTTWCRVPTNPSGPCMEQTQMFSGSIVHSPRSRAKGQAGVPAVPKPHITPLAPLCRHEVLTSLNPSELPSFWSSSISSDLSPGLKRALWAKPAPHFGLYPPCLTANLSKYCLKKENTKILAYGLILPF